MKPQSEPETLRKLGTMFVLAAILIGAYAFHPAVGVVLGLLIVPAYISYRSSRPGQH